MRDRETNELLVAQAIGYTKQALSLVYPEKGIFNLEKIEKKPGYAINDGIAHFIFMDGWLELGQSGNVIFKSKAQFLTDGQAIKPQLLELKLTGTSGTMQFYFKEEKAGECPAYQLWGSNYLKQGGEQNKTG